MLPNKRKSYKKTIYRFQPFWPFLDKKNSQQKKPKLAENEENWLNSNRLMKFSEMWYLDASQQKKMLQKNFFLDFDLFWPLLTKKQPKLSKNEENWQNPNRLMKFSEIWDVDAS